MSTTEMATLGSRCRVFRHLRGLTLGELGLEADVNISTIWRIETDKVNPSAETLMQIAGALGIGTDVLLGLKNYDPEGDTWTK